MPSQGALLRCSQSVGLTCCPSQVRVQDPLVQRRVIGSQKWPLAGSLQPPSRLRAHHEPWRGAHASCPGQGFRRPLWSYHSESRTGPSFPRRCMRPQGHERVEGPTCASEGEPHWWNRKHAQRKLFSVEWWQAFTPAPRDRIPRLPLVPPVRGRTVAMAVSRRAPRGSSPFTDELLPTIHAIVASSPSLLRVALFTAAPRWDPWVHHLATVRTEPHRRISTPMIHVGTQTLHHEPLSPLQ